MTRWVSIAMTVASIGLPTGAIAQSSDVMRVHGTIDSIDGKSVTVKTSDGSAVKVQLPSDYKAIAYSKASFAQVKINSYIGVVNTPNSDGTQKAVAITVYPESARGSIEGVRPYDTPNIAMTNATVTQIASTGANRMLVVKYKGGEARVAVAPDTPVATFKPAEKSDLKRGVNVAFGVTKAADGSLEARRISFGQSGFVPF